MDADIAARVVLFPKQADQIIEHLPVNYILSKVKDNNGDCTYEIRFAANMLTNIDTTIGGTIEQFLCGIAALAQEISEKSPCIRVGVFYDIEETVVFPLQIPLSSIQLLGKFHASLDVTGYPCSDSDSPHGGTHT